MELGTYLFERTVEATTPPNETPAALFDRRAAIFEMIGAHEPANGAEGMVACHCVQLQITATNAMRDANNPALEPARVAKARSAAISASRVLLQWLGKLENLKKRTEARAAADREAAKAQPAAPEPTPEAPAEPPPTTDPATNARVAAAVMHLPGLHRAAEDEIPEYPPPVAVNDRRPPADTG